MATLSTNVDSPVQYGINADKSRSRNLPQKSINKFWDSLITKSPGKVFKIFPKSLYANLLPEHITPEGFVSREKAEEGREKAAEKCKAEVARIVEECRRNNEKFTDPDFNIEDDWRSGRRNCLKGLQVPMVPKGNKDMEEERFSVGIRGLHLIIGALVQTKLFGPQTIIPVDIRALQDALEDNGDESDDIPPPQAVHRIDYVFEEPKFPKFLKKDFQSSDVQQGATGDCWFVAAVATLCCKKGEMEKVCVAYDEESVKCGVYGFVFYRDGGWTWTIVDDNLYLRERDFDDLGDDYDPTGEKERRYKDQRQTGSEALHFAKCAKNETWLPLLEKAYAKIHGDYQAIDGGLSGDAVEDLTGGVTTTIYTNRIMDKNMLWKELLNKEEFIFGASPPTWLRGPVSSSRQGVPLYHAYSIMKAVEETGPKQEDDATGPKGKEITVKLVKLRNPWGKRDNHGVGEWTGPWSDGSREWTVDWINILKHKFGDDGVFWMSYDDFCRKFAQLYRTRLFGKGWWIYQQWTSVNVSWVSGYSMTKFVVEIKKPGTVVIVLSQLDSRYFRGLEGQYIFHLQFMLQKEDAEQGQRFLRAHASQSGIPDRSVSAEVDLEAGTYEVLPKISATRDKTKPEVKDVVTTAAEENPQKLRQIGLNYDIAHAKGGFPGETETMKPMLDKQRKAKEGKTRDKKQTEENLEGDQTTKEKVEKEETGETIKLDDSVTDTGKFQATAGPKSDEGEEGKSTTHEGVETAKDTQLAGKSNEDSKNMEHQKAKTDDVGKGIDGRKSIPEPAAIDKADGCPLRFGDAPESEPDVDGNESDNPWNAVAVIGLRVYSKDENLVIRLVKPKDDEEAALLDVDGGVSGAGATT